MYSKLSGSASRNDTAFGIRDAVRFGAAEQEIVGRSSIRQTPILTPTRVLW